MPDDVIWLGGVPINPETGQPLAPPPPEPTPPAEPPPEQPEQPNQPEQPSPEQQAKAEAEREQTLRDTIREQEATRNAIIAEGATPEQVAEFDRSAVDIRRKLDTLDQARAAEQSYRDAGEPIPDDVARQIEAAKKQALGPMAPFIDLEAGTANVIGALKFGLSDAEIRAAGIQQVDIVRAKAVLRQQALDVRVQAKVGEIEYADYEKALKDYEQRNLEQKAALSMIPDEFITRGQITPQFRDPKTGAPMRSPDEYDLVGYLRSHGDKMDTGVRILKAAGFPDEGINLAVRVIQAQDKLAHSGNAPLAGLLFGTLSEDDVRLALGDTVGGRYIEKADAFRKAEQSKQFGHGYNLGRALGGVVTTARITFFDIPTDELGRHGNELKELAQRVVSSVPSKGVLGIMAQDAVKIPLGLATGVFEATAGTVGLLQFVTSIPFEKNRAAYARETANSVARGFVDMGKRAISDPAFGLSEVAGMVLGPVGALKLARTVAVRASPWYVPNTAVRYSFSTGKLPVKYGEVAKAIESGRITEAQVARAIYRVTNRAMESPEAVASARIANTNIWIRIEPTPASKWMGSALWRAVPVKDAYTKLERVIDVQGKEPAEFYSLQAAPRFAMTSASGTPATSPALIMLYTKLGKLRAYPSSIQYASELSKMQSSGFKYLGSGRAEPGAYGPIKTYAGKFELEAMLPNGMKVSRVTNLASRLFGEQSGEFVTTFGGYVMPIFRFAEEGATIPKVGLAELAAIRIASIQQGIKILLGKKGFGAEAGRAAVGTLTDQLEATARAAGRVGSASYLNAISSETDRIIRATYEPVKVQVEQAWRADPSRFEDAYTAMVARSLAVKGYSLDREALRSDASYTTARVEDDRQGIENRARDFADAVARATYSPGEKPRTLGRVNRGTVSRPPAYQPPSGRTRLNLDRVQTDLRTLSRIPNRPPIRPDRIDRTQPPRFEIRTPPPPPGKGRLILESGGAGSAGRRVPDGSIVWAQGIFWKFVPPEDFNKGLKPRTLDGPPVGAVNTASRSPYDTVQVIGEAGAPVPSLVTVDLGVTDIEVRNGREISFVGKGEKTNVGERIDSPTQGMSVDESADLDGLTSGAPALSQSAVRPIRRSKPKKRASSEQRWYENMTSLKGLKV